MSHTWHTTVQSTPFNEVHLLAGFTKSLKVLHEIPSLQDVLVLRAVDMVSFTAPVDYGTIPSSLQLR
jgi:hypothetical protein